MSISGNADSTKRDTSYWDQARRVFRSSGLSRSAGSYLVHNKHAGYAKVGLGCAMSASLTAGRLEVEEGAVRSSAELGTDRVFAQIEKVARPGRPAFFISSPDLRRSIADLSIPLVQFAFPSIELTFDGGNPAGDVSFADQHAAVEAWQARLATAWREPLPEIVAPSRTIDSFSELSAGWRAAEDDRAFTARLAQAVEILAEHPDGKMTVTRAYERLVPSARLDPFSLYELHAACNGQYAFSHFACIREGLFSIGSSPENIFEISGRDLTVDVVAGTCRASVDPAVLRSELHSDPKQRREHLSSLENRQNRFRPFCEAGSMRVLQAPQVKALRNVCHLHSVFGGKLAAGTTVYELMENIFPLLGARPRELLSVADAESAPHRYYGGVVGHLGGEYAGGFLNIRNVLLQGNLLHAKVGTGVIRESTADDELIETQNKLSGILEAVQRWERAGSVSVF